MTDKVIHPRSSRRIRSIVMLSTMLFGAAACGSDAKSSADTDAAAPAATAGSTAAGDVTATESEFKIELSSSTLTAGAHVIDITNSGQFKHNITIDGPGVEDATSGDIQAGQTGQLSVTLQPGTYEVYCSVPTHKGKGMDMTITVA
jgi:plastocyanin